MNTRAIERRLKKIEKKIKTQDNAEILELIRQGAFYDELTNEQKDMYWNYLEHIGDHETMEQLIEMVEFTAEDKPIPPDFWHERIHYKQPEKKEKKSYKEIVEEVERIVLGCEDQEREQMETERN